MNGFGRRIRCKLVIRIISGQNLPKVPGDDSDIVDPHVTLKILGYPPDHSSYKTKSVTNNGDAIFILTESEKKLGNHLIGKEQHGTLKITLQNFI